MVGAVGISTSTSARAALAGAAAKTKTLLAAARIVAAAVRSGPVRRCVDDIRRSAEETLTVLRSGRLGPDDLARLAVAAAAAEEALTRIERFVVFPGPVGQAAAVAGALRLPLRLWARWVARDPAEPQRPAPVEAACLPAANNDISCR